MTAKTPDPLLVVTAGVLLAAILTRSLPAKKVIGPVAAVVG
ncbi:hypothetical protein [Amycolatopsis sp. EV170708-02-1]|nr:hypothetical protein [Amycolatopsis sp. EV170708-02-1]